MDEIGVRELRQSASEILRRVREGREDFLITYRGRVVARLTPFNGSADRSFDEVWADMDELAESVGKRWPKGLSAADAVREQRREL